MLKVNRNDFLIKPFLKRNNFRAFYQIISTIIPIISIWLIVYQIINQPFSLFIRGFLLIPFIILQTLFSSRTFSLMHDCGHNSLFTTRKLNRFLDFCLVWLMVFLRSHGQLIMHFIIEIMAIGKFTKVR